MTTNQFIKNARINAGLSQKKLAELIGVHPSMISQYENGTRNPKIETLQKIAEALGVSCDLAFNNSFQGKGISKKEFDETVERVTRVVLPATSIDEIVNQSVNEIDKSEKRFSVFNESPDKSPEDTSREDIQKIKFALFGTDGEITDEMLEDVKRYAQFIKERAKENKRSNE